MPCAIEVCLRHSRAVAAMAALALVLAANGRASADDSSPAAPRPVPPVDAASYGQRPPPVWPHLDEGEHAVPLMGPTYVAVETKYTMLAGGGGLLVGGQAGWTLDPHWEAGFAGYGLVSSAVPQEDGRDPGPLANPELPSLDSAAVSGAAAGMALKLGTF